MRPQSLSTRFSPADLVAQFVLSRERQVPGWQHHALGGWRLSVEPRLPCRRVRWAGEAAGWVLGHPVGPDGGVPGPDLALDPEALEQSIYTYGGRFLVILPLLQRVYLDPCGLLSAVYCPHQQTVASTIGLVPYDPQTADRDELLDTMGIPFNNAMFPMDLTPRRGIERILPNHYLDLGTWQTVRHWPAQPLPPVEDVPAAVEEIADICKRQLRAAVAEGPATLRLTAGKDSRMLLACARALTGQIECVTADLQDEMSEVDWAIAKRVARSAGVSHRVLPWIEPDERDLALWVYRSGFGTANRRAWRGATSFLRGLDGHRADVLGVGGEIGRGIWWEPEEGPDSQVTLDRLQRRAKCPATPETLGRLEDWLSRAVAGDSLQLLDLFFLEQRLGCWAGVLAYAEAAYSRQQAFPLAHRRIIELMMRLPVDYRRSGRLPDDVIAREWPELLREPFNTPTRPHQLLLAARAQGRRLRRAVTNPGPVIARRLRRRARQG